MPAPPAQPDQAPDFPTSGSRGGRPRIPGRLAAAFSLGKTGMDSGIGDGTGASEPVPVPPGHRKWGAGAGQGREPGAWGCVGFWGIPPFSPPLPREGLIPSFIPRRFWFRRQCFCQALASPPAGLAPRMTFEVHLSSLFFFFLPSCWLFFILHFSHPGLLSPPPPHPEELEFHPSLRALWEVWSHARCLPVGAGNGMGLH